MALNFKNPIFDGMRYLFLITILFFFGQIAHAQQDSLNRIKYTNDFRFTDGLYLNFNAVSNNDPIPAARIISKNDPGDFNFFRNLVEEKSIKYFDGYGSQKEVTTELIWGFCQDGKLYINYNDEFNRIPIVGQICHFISDVTVIESYNDPYYYDRYDYYSNPYYYRGNNRTTRSREMRQYILRFDTGDVLSYDRESILAVLMEDPELYEEFNGLRKRKQNDLMFFFLRRFNEKHPLYLPQR